MKAPNGYGTVAKLSGNRRNPFVVRKTTGWDERAYPIYKTIGYYPTREEGMIALAEYNRNPYDVDLVKITMEEVYEKWSARSFLKMSKSSASSLKSAYKKTTPLLKMPYRTIKAFHMQDCIDNCGCGYSTQWAIKNLFGHLDKFALELDVIMKSNAALTTAAPIPETSKVPFTDEEVNKLWAIQNQEWVDSILFFIYTGFRIGELLTLETSNIDLVERTMKGGIKTKSGKDRIVPIHSKIFDIVQRHVNQGNKYLFTNNGKQMSPSQYYIFWNTIMEQLGLIHTPHECRHTFRSRLDSAGANKVCIDLMMGHKSAGTGERVYTHKTIAELKTAIELIQK